jgi:hypothetical protein
MNKRTNTIFALSALLVASTLIMDTQKADATRLFARGPKGVAGAYGTSNQYGSRMGARALGANAGAGVRTGQWTGVNGAHVQSQGAFGYQKGVGAGRGGSWSASNAQGSASGSTKNQYNAQTGQGVRTSSEQVQNAATGKDYGYNTSTNYTKGQGATSVINTDNKGSYDVNWQKGQMPVVTPVPSSTPVPNPQ